MSDFISSSSDSHVPMVLAPDPQADAAVMVADAVEFARGAEGDAEGDVGGSSGGDELRMLLEMEGGLSPENGLEARDTYPPEGRLEARDTYSPEGRLEARTTSTLEQALDAVALEGMTAQEVTELESGDAGRMAAVLKVKDATEGPPATATSGRSGEEDGSGLNRVSIKALPPALRLKLVTAISRARDGGDFEQALREIFPVAGTGMGGRQTDGGTPDGFGGVEGYSPDAGGPEAYPPDAGGPEARPTAAGKPEACATGAGGAEACATGAGGAEACATGAGGAEACATVVELEARLAGMKGEYDRAKAEYDPRAQDLLEEMMDVKLDLREAQRARAGLLQEQRASHVRAMEAHADLMADAESPFLDLCEMTISLAQRNNDPILTEPDWPERIAKQVRGKFFKGAAARSAALVGSRPQIPVPPAPQARVRLPGSPVGGGFAPGSITPETALAEFDQLTPEEQETALAQIARAADGRRR
ncbi:MAG TPA: hypothetical protein VGE39_12450 [Prosthecobacter sp.]